MPFYFKILVVAALAMIVLSLGQGLFYMLKDDATSDRAVKALTIRVGLSVTLFILLLIGFSSGFFGQPPA